MVLRRRLSTSCKPCGDGTVLSGCTLSPTIYITIRDTVCIGHVCVLDAKTVCCALVPVLDLMNLVLLLRASTMQNGPVWFPPSARLFYFTPFTRPRCGPAHRNSLFAFSR